MRAMTEDTLTAWRDNLPDTPVMNAHAYALLRSILTTPAKGDAHIKPPVVAGAAKAKTTHKAELAALDELATIVASMPERYRLAILLMSWCALRFGRSTNCVDKISTFAVLASGSGAPLCWSTMNAS